MKKKNLGLRIFFALFAGIPLTGAIVFLPAWTLDFWEGWVFLAVLFVPMIFFVSYMVRFKRDLIERRLRLKEKRPAQKYVQAMNLILVIAVTTIAGLDNRFNWSPVPDALVIFADAMILAGYLIFMFSMLHNEYASRIIDVEKGQKLVDTGPYSLVRHPMYIGGILMYIFIPLALGSYWAIIPMVFLPLSLMLRIFDEEKALKKDLEGYEEYMKRVRYRLIPYVW